MLASWATYGDVASAAKIFFDTCVTEGDDPVELCQAALNRPNADKNVIMAPDVTFLADQGASIPSRMALRELLTICDGETALCFVVLKARGR